MKLSKFRLIYTCLLPHTPTPTAPPASLPSPSTSPYFFLTLQPPPASLSSPSPPPASFLAIHYHHHQSPSSRHHHHHHPSHKPGEAACQMLQSRMMHRPAEGTQQKLCKMRVIYHSRRGVVVSTRDVMDRQLYNVDEGTG